MSIVVSLLLIALGLVLLTVGGEFLVRGASSLAAVLGITPLVIGLTVVAFGTSAPELAVTVSAAYRGEADVAVGNVVGSNICNVLFILGISALVAPLIVSSQLIRLDVPIMIAASLATYALAWNGELSRLDGGLLFGGLVVYIVWSIRASRREQRAVVEEYEKEYRPPKTRGVRVVVIDALLIVGGLVLLGFGSDLLVRGAAQIARTLGVSELVIGLTIVAMGTSLPEAAASVVAAFRGERDIAVGNVVGSNLFNLLSVLGLGSLVAPAGIAVSKTALQFHMPIMIAVSVACLPVFFAGRRITRWNGAMFFGYYLAYLTTLVLQSIDAPASDHFDFVMLAFVIPLTVIALLVSVVRSIRAPSHQSEERIAKSE